MSRNLPVRITLLAVLFGLVACTVPARSGVAQAQPAAQPLLVLPFVSNQEVLDKALVKERRVPFGLDLSGVLVQSLLAEGYTEVLPRDQLQRILEERNLIDKGVIADDDAREIATQMRARYLLACSITGFRTYKPKGALGGSVAEVEISGRVVDLNSGKLLPVSLLAYGRKSVGQNGLDVLLDVFNATTLKTLLDQGDKWMTSFLGEAARLATAEMARKFLHKIIDGGANVSKIDAKQNAVFIDRGKALGVQAGEPFVVYLLKQEKDQDQKVIFEEQVAVLHATVETVGTAASKLKVTRVEAGSELKDLEKSLNQRIPFVASRERKSPAVGGPTGTK